MPGYYHDEDRYEGRQADGGRFDTLNLSEPVRPQQFETSSFGQGPHRPQAFDTMNFDAPVRGPSAQGAHQTFDTMNLEAPVRRPSAAPQSNKPAGSKFQKETQDPSGETPIHPKSPEQKSPLSVDDSTEMAPSLVIIALCLRIFEVLLLIIALSLIASYSKDLGDITLSFGTLQSTKYALATTIIGVLYSILEVVLVTVRLIAGHPLLPGKISSYVSYIGDQVMIVLLLTGGTAAAAVLNELKHIVGGSFCTDAGTYCEQIAAGVAMIFLGLVCLGGNLTISAFCFFRNKV